MTIWCDTCNNPYDEDGYCSCTENERMANEGLKYDKGKPDWSLLPPDAVEDIVRVYDLGVSKYGRDNWRKGILYSRIFAAIMRHLWAWWRGADRNEEDGGLRHLAQAAWGCLTLLEYTRNGQYQKFDDRITAGVVSEPPVSVPSVWTPQKPVSYEITTTCLNPDDEFTYIFADGQKVSFDNKG